MIKNTAIALVATAALAGLAAPAMAATFSSDSDSSSSNGASVTETTSLSNSDFDSDYVLTALKDKGIDASSVQEWGSSYLVAWVTGTDGNQTMIYLDPDTYEIVTP